MGAASAVGVVAAASADVPHAASVAVAAVLVAALAAVVVSAASADVPHAAASVAVAVA